MALSAVGLHTHIWNNNLKSAILLMAFPLLLLGMLWLAAYLTLLGLPDAIQQSNAFVIEYGVYVFIGVAIWFCIAFFWHNRLIAKAANARPVTRQEEPELYNMLENLCISRGIPMPKLAIIEDTALNAFASGLQEKNYTITFTRGLLTVLNPEEIEAVMAHELTHILNKDVRLLIITVIFVGIISFLAEMAFRSLVFGGRRRLLYGVPHRQQQRGNNGKILIVAAIVLAIGYAFAIVLRFALSRKREYLADAGAVELTKNPEAMISALEKISGNAALPEMPAEVAQMCIENAPAKNFMGLFATHPPIKKRIATLQRVSIQQRSA